jgi:hypothetical protein
MTDIATGAQIATATAALDPTLIGYWQFGMWETEQDMTIENFKVIPEPATIDVFGYTWETTEGIHEEGANPEILYTVNDPNSITTVLRQPVYFRGLLQLLPH